MEEKYRIGLPGTVPTSNRSDKSRKYIVAARTLATFEYLTLGDKSREYIVADTSLHELSCNIKAVPLYNQ